jgi:toxin CcdB
LPRQFDVHRVPLPGVPFVVVVQSSLLADLASCVVIPLVPVAQSAREAVPRLKPGIDVDGVTYTLVTTDMAALPVRSLGPAVTNIEETSRGAILAAIDLLIFGV